MERSSMSIPEFMRGGEITQTLLSTDYKEPLRVAIPMIMYDHGGDRFHNRNEVYDGEETARPIASSDYKEPFRVAIPVLTPDRANKRQNGRRMKENGDDEFTLTAQDIHSVAIDSDEDVATIYYPKEDCDIAVRKLTPKEYFRLQGWSDDYFEKAEFVNSNTQLYKQAGNGVTVSVIAAIARGFHAEDQERD